jgi:hypothetical protein
MIGGGEFFEYIELNYVCIRQHQLQSLGGTFTRDEERSWLRDRCLEVRKLVGGGDNPDCDKFEGGKSVGGDEKCRDKSEGRSLERREIPS